MGENAASVLVLMQQVSVCFTYDSYSDTYIWLNASSKNDVWAKLPVASIRKVATS
jgi:hypothetical protein